MISRRDQSVLHFSKDYLGGGDQNGLERTRGKGGSRSNLKIMTRQEMKVREGQKEVTGPKKLQGRTDMVEPLTGCGRIEWNE